MPSSSKCSATNPPTAIVLSKANKITDNGIKSTCTRIPTYKFYGEKFMGPPQTAPKPGQSDREPINGKQQNDNSNSMSDRSCRTMRRLHKVCTDDEVLVQRDGGQLFLGVVKDIQNDSFLIRFANDTEHWSTISKITQLKVKEESSMCVICKEYDDIVHVCSMCQRGFHKKCIDTPKSDECSSDWYCHKCSTLTLEDAARLSSEMVKASKTPNSCYCEEKGDWFMQMLQCARCLQWFHAKCVKCLNFPLYFGDK